MASAGEQSLPPLFVLQKHVDPVLCCRFYPSEAYQRDESNWFLTGDAGGLVVLWNLCTRREIISFSVLTEAHRQLRGGSQRGLESGTRTRAEPVPGNEGLSEQANTSPLGPHSRSILSVGFIPLSLSSLQPTEHTGHSGGVVEVLRGRGTEGAMTNAPVCPTPLESAAKGTTGWAQQGRQRFRLPRRAPTPCVTSGQEPCSSVGDVVNDSVPGVAFAPSSTICFYTHCRDQRVYIWCLRRPCVGVRPISACNLEPRLVAVLTAPQHGFCPVESVSKTVGPFTRTYLAIPHDSGGEVTVWELAWRQPGSARFASAMEAEKGSLDRPPSSSGSASVCEDEEEEMSTSELNPMDAFIARAAAEERRQAKMKQKSSRLTGESESDDLFLPAALPKLLVSRGERSSMLCYVDPAATTGSSNFSIRLLCTFSACPTFKGGTIMRLTMCRDAQHIAVAFESGHIVLARYRIAHVTGMSDQPGETRQTSVSVCEPQVRNVTRAFAESALVCWWSGRRMLACSAEGGMHCYNMVSTAEGLLEAQLVWSVTLRKGIGSVFLQRNLVVAGCWDSTLRLYDARDGRLVSILSYQRGAINEVRMAPPTIARVAAFGFDVRQPRLYADLPDASSTTTTTACIASSTAGVKQEGMSQYVEAPLCEASTSDTMFSNDRSGAQTAEEQLVYLFASASKDSTVALWRVDLGVAVEAAAAARSAITA
ncbi:hypothetical protein JKF63_00701 [Porcisia hertigi]|uniref:Uncharacterized protein n=1 Tax=Porcisia hertigi TaxID=2761500 RepID=A0A836KXB2_9TRYP|nr:hypothetical protein JKF63_00701 [Porcisia hertigi]